MRILTLLLLKSMSSISRISSSSEVTEKRTQMKYLEAHLMKEKKQANDAVSKYYIACKSSMKEFGKLVTCSAFCLLARLLQSSPR